MHHDIHQSFSLLGNIKKPGWSFQRTTRYILKKVVHRFFGNCRLINRSYLQFSKEFRHLRQHSLYKDGDFKTLRHNIVKKHLFLLSKLKCFLQDFKIFSVDRHRFIGQYIDSYFNSLFDVLSFLGITSCHKHDIPWLILYHFFKKVRSDIHFFHPVGRVICSLIIAFNSIQMILYIGSVRCKHISCIIQIFQMCLLDETGMKMTRI